jgi:hypothetical protein
MTNLEKIENYSVEQLNEHILQLVEQKKRRKRAEKRKSFGDALSVALGERQSKLNRDFEWTPENCEKFLLLNQQLIQLWEKLHHEAKQTFDVIQSRINDPDDFLQDFNMTARIEVYICVPDENGKLCGVQDFLIDSICELVNSQSYYCETNFAHNIYLDREQNWNFEHRFEGKFDNHFISQAIHDLYDHTYLSYCDMLKINSLWADLSVDYQHSRDFVYVGEK